MKINSVVMKSLVMMLILHFFAGKSNAQNDSTWYIFAGAQHTILNSFKSQSFLDGWPDISQNSGILSFEAGLVLRSRSKPKNWSGLRIQISNTISNALSRSKYVSFREMGRTISYISSDNLGLSMISLGYLYCRSFKENSRSGFFINPNIVFGTMKEKFVRDFDTVSKVESTGIDLLSGVMWYPIREIGIKAFFGYRILKMKIDIFEATGEPVNWSGPYIGAGISITFPWKELM